MGKTLHFKAGIKITLNDVQKKLLEKLHSKTPCDV